MPDSGQTPRMAAETTNHCVTLTRHPEGALTSDCFTLETRPSPALADGEVRVRVGVISVDAAIRTTLFPNSFHPGTAVGDVIRSPAAGHIIESNDPEWPVGQAVMGPLGAQSIAVVSVRHLRHIDDSQAPLNAHLGALSLSTGITAWIGVRDIAKPAAGETFVVSAAAGAVGSLAGQIAKLDGARVIGIAGGADKSAMLVDELGFDAAIDYRNEDVAARLKELAPDGINVFFDNVGGDILDAALDNLAMRARVVICGAVSQYHRMDDVQGPSLYLRLAERQSRMEGFAYYFFPDSFAPATAEMAGWLEDGSIVMSEHVLDGLEEFGTAVEHLYTGANFGKTLVRVDR